MLYFRWKHNIIMLAEMQLIRMYSEVMVHLNKLRNQIDILLDDEQMKLGHPELYMKPSLYYSFRPALCYIVVIMT